MVEGQLHRMQVGIGRFGEAFDGRDRLAVNSDRQQRAALHRDAVDMDDTGAALRGIAADMGTGEIEVLAEEIG